MNFKKKGESIIEVLIAIIILTVVMTAAFKVLINTSRTNVDVKNRIIALNIAREGIEAVRNIRDTNWFKYAGNTDTKWLCYDTITDKDKCLGTVVSADLLVDGFYTVNFSSTDDRYFLDLISTDPGELLNLETPATKVEDFHLYKKDNERFTHDPVGNTASPFYHQIELEIPPAENICNSSANNNCAEEKLKIISRVQWLEGEESKNTVLETYLFNFYNRKSY